MNTLIVVANPNPASFNHRLVEVAKQTLTDLGHEVNVLDLYDVEIAKSNVIGDFSHGFDKKDYDYKTQQKVALTQGSFNDAIQASHDLIRSADYLIFQFPLWWFSMPAIMRSWIEKSFTFDFAYNGRERRWFSDGPFNKKHAMLSITTSGPEHIYQSNGINGEMDKILWPIHNGILNFTGFNVLRPFICWGTDQSDDEKKKQYEESLIERLREWRNESPLYFHPLEHFDKNYVLKEEFEQVYQQ